MRSVCIWGRGGQTWEKLLSKTVKVFQLKVLEGWEEEWAARAEGLAVPSRHEGHYQVRRVPLEGSRFCLMCYMLLESRVYY